VNWLRAAAWAGNLVHVLPAPGSFTAVKHQRALPYADLPSFMRQLAARDAIAARALEFTILTAARRVGKFRQTRTLPALSWRLVSWFRARRSVSEMSFD
jgi:hypothetical protein